MAAYYNEFDPYAAACLRALIKAGLIADGEVDERSIKEVVGADLAGFEQCHFFAGIGGWSYALRLAGWDDTRPVWTGSCPCQPFSGAGRAHRTADGFSDPRDLWPVWRGLIQECRPPSIFGEQSKDEPLWIDRMCLEMEDLGYAVAAAILPACAAGAPHRRDRLWFVADSGSDRLEGALHRRDRPASHEGVNARRATAGRIASAADPVADSERAGLSSGLFERRDTGTIEPGAIRRGRYGYPIGPAWDSEPELAVLVHGLPAEISATISFGNAIVPQVAAEFIQAADEAMTSMQPQT